MNNINLRQKLSLMNCLITNIIDILNYLNYFLIFLTNRYSNGKLKCVTAGLYIDIVLFRVIVRAATRMNCLHAIWIV